MGTPLYGYDWPADPSQPDGYGTAVSRNYQEAEALRVQYGAVRRWSAGEAAPYFTYTAADGVGHVVWYNDADATTAKLTLIGKYGLRGLVFWAVGHEDTRQWPGLRSYAVQRSTALTITAPTAVTYGTAATVAGKLTTSTGAAVAGQKVVLQWRAAGATTWRTVATGTTSSTGTASLRYAPASNGSFRLSAPSSWSYLASTSASVPTQVRWRVSAALLVHVEDRRHLHLSCGQSRHEPERRRVQPHAEGLRLLRRPTGAGAATRPRAGAGAARPRRTDPALRCRLGCDP